MKIERKEPGFRPITLTLETKEEVNALLDLVEPTTPPRADPMATLDLSNQIADYMSSEFPGESHVAAQQEP